MKTSVRKVSLYAMGLVVVAGCVVGSLMIDTNGVEVGDALSDVEKMKGKPDQIWKSSDSPSIDLWFGDEMGKTIENANLSYVYFSGIDYVDLYVVDENEKIAAVYSGGT